MKKYIKKVITILLTSTLILTNTLPAHAQDLSQYYAMSAQLMQMAAMLQAQAAAMNPYGVGVTSQVAPIQADAYQAQAAQAQQVMLAQQAMQAQQALQAQQAQQAFLAQQAMQAQQAALLAAPTAQPTVAYQPQVGVSYGGSGAGNADNFYTYDNPNQQQTDARYVLNLNTHKFHYPRCDEVRKIKPENYQATNASRDDVVNSGFQPCGKCMP